MSNWKMSRMSMNDIKKAEDKKWFNSNTIEYLKKTKDVNNDPKTCIDHRRAMEIMREKHNYYSDKKAWNDTNHFIHTYNVDDFTQ